MVGSLLISIITIDIIMLINVVVAAVVGVVVAAAAVECFCFSIAFVVETPGACPLVASLRNSYF